jgi:hypothetical protein
MNTHLRSSSAVLATFLGAGLLLATACTKPTPPQAPSSSIAQTTSAMTTTTEEEPAEACELNCGTASVTARPSTPDHHAAAVADADRVFRSMHEDLLACYKKRVRARPNAHAFVTVDVVVKEDGSVSWTETTGGAHLMGGGALKCITDRIEKAHFLPVVGGGTRRIHVPLTFRMLAPGEDS